MGHCSTIRTTFTVNVAKLCMVSLITKVISTVLRSIRHTSTPSLGYTFSLGCRMQWHSPPIVSAAKGYDLTITRVLCMPAEQSARPPHRWQTAYVQTDRDRLTAQTYQWSHQETSGGRVWQWRPPLEKCVECKTEGKGNIPWPEQAFQPTFLLCL